MTETIRQAESTVVRTLYVAFELANATWKLAVTTDRGERPRHYTVAAGDVAAAFVKLERARGQWGLPAAAEVVSCYEAGRDGFWLHRCLTAHGLLNVVVDPTSIERDARAKRVKTDRVDAERLLTRLVEWRERRKRLRVVRVPTVAEEDARQADRELATAKAVRTAIRNRMTGVLIAQGVRVALPAGRRVALAPLHLGDGSPLPPNVRARLEREDAAREAVQQRIVGLERARREAIAAQTTPTAAQTAQLMRLVGVGANGASRVVVECFGWRAFRNGREIGV